jgi:hypothetical protein
LAEFFPESLPDDPKPAFDPSIDVAAIGFDQAAANADTVIGFYPQAVRIS